MEKLKKTQTAKKGDLVLVHFVVMEPCERAANLPEVTRSVPYEGWIKGYLLDDQAKIGQMVRIESFIGRQLIGTLTEINPIYDHNFGKPQPTLNYVGLEAWKKLEGRGDNT